MKILVGIKYGLKVEELVIDPRSGAVSEEDTPKQMDIFSKKALEEAIRIKEKHGGTITVVAIAPEEARKIIIEAYAMGADEGYLIKGDGLDTYETASIIAKLYKEKGPFDLILLGGATADSYTATVPSIVASILNIPLLPMANKVTVEGDNVIVESNLKDGTYTYRAKLPVVISVTLDINEPRIPKLPQILKAKRKPINIMSLGDIGVEPAQKLVVGETKAFTVERKRIIMKVDDPSKIEQVVDQLIEKLKEEGVL